MMGSGGGKKDGSSYGLYCFAKCGNIPPTPEREQTKDGKTAVVSSDSKKSQKKHSGWKVMPLILGNETFERLATYGLSANFMVYFMTVYQMEQVAAANVLNIWSGITNFAPLLGAFVADAYVGRFRTIAFASFAAILGMAIMTLTAWLPSLHPPKCDPRNQQLGHCQNATTVQLVVLFMGLGLLSIATGGIRPNSIPFGVDQFDPSTRKGRKGISSFYNWYYATFTFALTLAFTLVVYVQTSVSWVIGFGIPTLLMACSIILFFAGVKFYVHATPDGSIFSSILQVFVAAFKKRQLKLPEDGEIIDMIFYDPPAKETLLSKLPLTNECRFLNRAAMVSTHDLKPDGSAASQWRLCSVQQVEEVKCLLKVGPIWASGIIGLISLTQQATFTISQALVMDRHMGHKFQVPASSMIVISMITVAIWLPFYDRVVIPALRKITKQEGGITLLQRIGIGLVLSIASMVIAGLIERERRDMANSDPKGAPMSVFWLAPQLVVMGFYEAFNATGQIEFYNKEFPEHMRSLANSLFFCSLAGASYLSALMISIVHKVTKTHDHPDWLTNDLNAGRLEYFYFLIAGMGVLNMGYFLFCATRYKYKVVAPLELDVELSSTKLSG